VASGAGAGAAVPAGGVAGSSDRRVAVVERRGGAWWVLGSGGSRRGDTVVRRWESAARTMGVLSRRLFGDAGVVAGRSSFETISLRGESLAGHPFLHHLRHECEEEMIGC